MTDSTIDYLDTYFRQISSHTFEDSVTVTNLLDKYFKCQYIKEEHPKGFHFYVKSNSPEEAKAIDKWIQKSLHKPKYKEAANSIQKDLDDYYGKDKVVIELSDIPGNEYRLAIIANGSCILYGDFDEYPYVDLYCGDEVEDLCHCHYTDKDTFLLFIDNYYTMHNTVTKIKDIQWKYSCQEIWERIAYWVYESGAELGSYSNGFDRKGKAYLHDLIKNYPEYADEILGLF